MKCRPRKIITRVIVFLLLGAIVNVVVAWVLFPGKVSDWSELRQQIDIDQSHLIAMGLPEFEQVDRELLRSIGFVDCAYATQPASNKYRMLWAREISCGWPILSFNGLRWNPMAFDGEKQQFAFTGERVLIRAIHLDEARLLHGEREFLPIGLLWPGFAINTIFYAAVLWVVFFVPGMVNRGVRRTRGRCPACAYPIGTSDVCTECGGAIRSLTSKG